MAVIWLALAAALNPTGIAMATELVDVARLHCADVLTVDEAAAAALKADLRQFDIGGINSAVSPALNLFYEEFAAAAKADAAGFCTSVPDLAARAGYANIFRNR